jgi:hypothetical protein
MQGGGYAVASATSSFGDEFIANLFGKNSKLLSVQGRNPLEVPLVEISMDFS